ncbi:MAG: molybdate ABC transporter permease subunit [Bacteroidetes bacterium]|nr:MAG: molybdate ABC transporter permease subunit [Bacteroidota bacterium]
MSFWEPIWLSLKLAACTSIILFVIAVPITYWLSLSKSIWKPLVETIITLPLVLPPTVLGFYFLMVFGTGNPFGAWLEEHLGMRFVFSFEGLVLASVIYSFPFMVQPIQNALSSLPKGIRETAWVYGKGKWKTLFQVLLPSIRPSILSAVILTFVHTMGEFGMVLLIGGSIPGETRLASIAIFEEVEALNYANAHSYSLILISFAFVIVLILNVVKSAKKTVL